MHFFVDAIRNDHSNHSYILNLPHSCANVCVMINARLTELTDVAKTLPLRF